MRALSSESSIARASSSSTIHTQIIHDAGEELLKERNAFAVVRRRREDVAVNNGDGIKGIGQDTSCKEPSQTATDDQGMATSVPLCTHDGLVAVIHCRLPFLKYSSS